MQRQGSGGWYRDAVETRVPAGERVLRARWLGRIPYRPAWALQQACAAARASGTLDEDQILLLEHDPVLTLGRNADPAHVLALPGVLAERGIDVIRVERGGEVTYHGPGQLVAYPIVALGSGATGSGTLGVRHFVEALEAAMVDTCRAGGVEAGLRTGHPGAWIEGDGPFRRKIGALGIRVARGVSFHGIALNITTCLADFDLIDPCGMPGLHSTSLESERARLGLPGAYRDAPPSTESVAAAAAVFARALAHRLGARLEGALPPDADPAAEIAILRTLEVPVAAGMA